MLKMIRKNPPSFLLSYLKQISSRSLRLGANRRKEVIEELAGSSTVVLQLLVGNTLLSCQPRVTVKSYFVYKVIMDLSSIEHLCINPIHRIGLIHK